MRHALLAPGKRLRPMLALMAALGCGGGCQAALDAACAVEMVHAASLVLDDLPAMDDAAMRRGQPTVHVAYGEDIAMLTSVGLLNRAFATLARAEGLDCETRVCLSAVLSDAIGSGGLLGGQEADLRDRETMVDPVEIERLNHAKTGALFEAAVTMGAMTANARGAELAALKRFSRHLGTAFQTMDDLLDRMSPLDAAHGAIGKDVGKDKDKVTLVNIFGVEGSRQAVAHHVDQACGCLEDLGAGPEPMATYVRAAFASVLEA